MTTRHSCKETSATLPLVRCAIYTRKSTEEGLEQEFNSLDAQREAGEAYIKSKQTEGWTCLPERYDDGGFTGGNTDRPALQRLLTDIAAGKVDCVVIYKLDRLRRSLLDFAAMMQLFEKHQVSFVSVTQQFHSGTSMGRLMLNVLLSFAQFEREIIAERTRDKIAATRRKGKWTGGRPLLGYDVDPQGSKLRVNEPEAERVRAIFALYLEREALLPVAQELERRGWVNKRWQTRKGPQPFTRTNLYRSLTNVAYLGRVRYKDEVHPGEHAALVDPVVFEQVQHLLRRHGPDRVVSVRTAFGALLKGLLRCAPCGCAMTLAHTTRQGKKRYRYYVCSGAQKRGWQTCPSKSIPAAQIEQFVVEQIRALGRDPALLTEVLARARAQGQAAAATWEAEQRALEHDLSRWHGEVRQLTGQLHPGDDNGAALARLADLQERIGRVEHHVQQLRAQIRAAQQGLVDADQAALALAAFAPTWEAMPAREQARMVDLLVQQVDYDGAQGKVTITFHATGIQTLAHELLQKREEKTA